MRKENTTEADNMFEGYCIDLMDELKTLMGFDYEIKWEKDDNYGKMDEDGNWSGMIRMLMDKVTDLKYIKMTFINHCFIQEVDIALGALSVMAERENVVDFTVPYYDLVGITILMKKTKQEPALFKFLSVLEDAVWGCILAAYFVTR